MDFFFYSFLEDLEKELAALKTRVSCLTEKESEQLGNSNITHTVNLSIYIFIRTNISEHS